MGPDLDGDRVPDAVDNCGGVFNPDQRNQTEENGAGNACDSKITSAHGEPIAIVRFTATDQFGNPIWDFQVSGTVTRYFPDGSPPTEGPMGVLAFDQGAAEFYLPVMWQSCDPTVCEIPTTIDYSYNPVSGCDVGGASGSVEAKAGEIRYVNATLRCAGVQIALVDADYNPLPGGCFAVQADEGGYQSSVCDTQGDGIVQIMGLAPGYYRTYLAEGGSQYDGSSYSGFYGRSIDRDACIGWERVLIVDGSAGMYYMTMRILCNNQRPNPPQVIRCAGSDCYMVLSIESTRSLALYEPSFWDAPKDLANTLFCESLGGMAGQIPKFGDYLSITTGWACGGAAAYAEGNTYTMEDASEAVLKSSACSLVDEFIKRSVIGPICSVADWMGTNWLDWMKQSEIIDAGVLGGCYVIPVNQYSHEPDYGWHQQNGFPVLPPDPWCYSESGSYMGDWD
jgi:hypothetical protein